MATFRAHNPTRLQHGLTNRGQAGQGRGDVLPPPSHSYHVTAAVIVDPPPNPITPDDPHPTGPQVPFTPRGYTAASDRGARQDSISSIIVGPGIPLPVDYPPGPRIAITPRPRPYIVERVDGSVGTTIGRQRGLAIGPNRGSIGAANREGRTFDNVIAPISAAGPNLGGGGTLGNVTITPIAAPPGGYAGPQ